MKYLQCCFLIWHTLHITRQKLLATLVKLNYKYRNFFRFFSIINLKRTTVQFRGGRIIDINLLVRVLSVKLLHHVPVHRRVEAVSASLLFQTRQVEGAYRVNQEEEVLVPLSEAPPVAGCEHAGTLEGFVRRGRVPQPDVVRLGLDALADNPGEVDL